MITLATIPQTAARGRVCAPQDGAPAPARSGDVATADVDAPSAAPAADGAPTPLPTTDGRFDFQALLQRGAVDAGEQQPDGDAQAPAAPTGDDAPRAEGDEAVDERARVAAAAALAQAALALPALAMPMALPLVTTWRQDANAEATTRPMRAADATNVPAPAAAPAADDATIVKADAARAGSTRSANGGAESRASVDAAVQIPQERGRAGPVATIAAVRDADAGAAATAPAANAQATPQAQAQAFAPLQAAQSAATQVLALHGSEPSQWRESLREALGDRLQVQVGDRSERAVIRLDPPTLGRIEIVIRHEAGNLQVHLSASNGDVLRQLHTIGDSLRQDLVHRQYGEVAVVVSEGRGESGSQRRGREGPAEADTPGRALGDADGTAEAGSFAFMQDRE